MECLLQYLDDLDDFFGMLALAAERVRRIIRTLVLISVTISVHLAGLMLAVAVPPMALAVVSLLAVGMLYRAVVTHPGGTPAPRQEEPVTRATWPGCLRGGLL